jgi:putative ABC transport system ATP-binding protein
MIESKNLAFSYPGLPFHFPDISCKKGEVLLVTGSSGKGKTTLLHLLGGLQQPTSGTISINGTNITALSTMKLDQFRGAQIGIIFQQPHFVASLNILQNLELASSLANKKIDTVKAKQLLAQLAIGDQAFKKPAKLSQGQLQRASIARALMNQPSLLLADEPTSSLDDENAAKVADMLAHLSKEYKASLIIVTHDYRLKSKFSNQLNLN